MSEKPAFLQAVSDTRAAIEGLVGVIKNLKTFPTGFEEADDKGEVIANIMIALRHAEDAKMRLGRVVRAYVGGKSIYDEAPKTQ